MLRSKPPTLPPIAIKPNKEFKAKLLFWVVLFFFAKNHILIPFNSSSDPGQNDANGSDEDDDNDDVGCVCRLMAL